MSNSEKDYDVIIKERSDSFLAYVAKAAEDDMLDEFDQWEKEAADAKVPAKTEFIILSMADEFHKIQTREERKKIFKRLIRIAAVVVLAAATTLTALTVSVEAVRSKVFEFLFQENEEYMNVTPVETSGNSEKIKSLLPDDWENTYYPDYLPKGYEFKEAEDNGISHMIAFQNDNGDVLLFSQQPSDDTGMIVDNEGTEKGELTINENPAFWMSKNGETTLVWSRGSTRFMAYGKMDLDELTQIAENMIFIK
jgi:hypothetical protein